METTLLTTTSADGTTIAYEADGSGPPLVLVGGALNSRMSAVAYVPLLSDQFTVVRYDRRGRGDSGDTQPYAPEREVEDLEALVAALGGEPAHVFGHSSGAHLALELARSGAPVAGLALYEPPYFVDDARDPLPADHLEHLAALDAGGKLEYFMTRAVGVPEQVVEGMKASPMWDQLSSVAHTLIYDNTIMWPLQQQRPLPAEWAAELADIPVLVIDGGNSQAWMRNSAQALTELLPRARRITLEGCDHTAPPETVAALLRDFFGEEN